MKYFISTCNFSTDIRKKITETVYNMVAEGIKNVEISSLHPFEENIEEKLVGIVKKYNATLLLHNFSR